MLSIGYVTKVLELLNAGIYICIYIYIYADILVYIRIIIALLHCHNVIKQCALLGMVCRKSACLLIGRCLYPCQLLLKVDPLGLQLAREEVRVLQLK